MNKCSNSSNSSNKCNIKFFVKILLILIFSIFFINSISFASTQTESERNEVLNAKESWCLGYYYPWGGTFTESSSSYCLKEPIYIEPGTYYIAINDSRFQLSIHQFDENDNWINNYKDKLCDNSTITIGDTTSYIKINLSSNTWGVSPYDYLDYGLSINILKEYTTKSIEKVDLYNANLKDMSIVKSGFIVSRTGKPGLDLNQVYFNNYFLVDETKYVINLPDPQMSMQIIEYDENSNVINDSTLRAGRTWEKQEETSYIAINIKDSSKKHSYEDYIEELSQYEKTVLTKYEKYIHNTEFDVNFKAYDFAKAMNIGWNLGDALGSGYCTEVGEDLNLMLECSWGNPYVTKDLIDCVAEQGFNTIRMPVTWYPNCGIDENGHLVIGKKWLSRVQDVLDYAIANDMYVIMNTMCDEGNLFYVGVEDETEWNEVLQNASDLWSQIAEFFKDYDEHLIFESYNEIGTKSGWTYSKLATSQINELNQVFTDAVRKTGGNNKYRLLMVPTYTTSSKENITADFKLPEDENPGRIMVSTHVYNANYDEDLEWKFKSLEEFSIRVDAPIIIGEFGLNSNSTFQDLREVHMSNYLARATAHGIKCCIWDDNYSWQLIDRWDYSNIKTNLIEAMFEGYNNGIAYKTTKNRVYYNDINQFHIGCHELWSGKVSNTDYSTSWWGGLVMLNDARTSTKIKIPDNTDYISFSFKTIKEASEVWMVGITWFDKDGNYLTFSKVKDIMHRYKAEKVPEGAVYYTASFHDPYVNHTVAEYGNWLKEGKLSFNVTYINDDDFGLEKEIVNVSNYDYNNRTISENTEIKENENLNQCDLHNIYNWVSGTYSNVNGKYRAWASKICLKDYKVVKSGTEYNIKISDNHYKLDIFELDKDFNFKKANENLSDGDKYVVPEDVKYISLCLYSKDDMKFDNYKEAFTNGTLLVELKNMSEEEQKPSEDNTKEELPEEEQKPSEDDTKEEIPEEEQKPSEDESKEETPKEEQKPSEDESKEETPKEEQKTSEDESKEETPKEEQKPSEDGSKEETPKEEQKPSEDESKEETPKEEQKPSEDDTKEETPKEEQRPSEDEAKEETSKEEQTSEDESQDKQVEIENGEENNANAETGISEFVKNTVRKVVISFIIISFICFFKILI